LVNQLLSFLIFISLLVDFESNPILWEWSLTLSDLFSHFVLIVLVISYLRKSKFNIKNEDYVFSPIYLILSFLLGLIIVYIQEPLNYLFQYIPSLDDFNGFTKDVDELKMYQLPSLISSIILSPVIEELVFRKLIFRNLVKSYSLSLSFAFSSFLFAIIHLPDIQQVLITFLGGLIAAYLFYKSSFNIFYPIVFHITWNLIVHSIRYISFFNF
jgi:membrane protease YdiL (CAAX protease family)